MFKHQITFLLMKKIISFSFLIISGYAASIAAQGLKIPQMSPSQTVEQSFSLSNIKIDYARPSARGRKVFGDVVPFGKVWRTGANKATVVSFGEDVNINGKLLKAGEYSLFSIPNQKEWTIIFNSNTKLWGTLDYKQDEDVLRVSVPTEKTSRFIETFTIELQNITTTAATLEIKWENTLVKINIQTATDQDGIIMKSIAEAMKGEKKPYYQAANYYFQNKKNMKQALEWVEEACKADTNAFWMEHLKAKIQFELKDFKGAIRSAESSKFKATRTQNYDYVKNNDELIAEIKKKDK